MQSSASLGAKSVLAAGGVAVSLLMLNIVRRHQLYYRCYIARAREIEERLKVQDTQIVKLYSLGKDAAAGSCTISNKYAFSAFSIIAAVFFVGSVIHYGCEFIRQTWP
jgi:hypothetical protein